MTSNSYAAATKYYQAQAAQRTQTNTSDDYERWYTETTPNNRMLLSLRSGIDSEIEWALDRLCRLCHNEQFLLKAIPGLTEALYEWPEYYVREGAQKIAKTQGMFSLDPVQAVHTRHALDSLFVLRNSASNEPNAAELSKSSRIKHLVVSILHNIQPDSSTNVEFLLHAIDLLYTIIPSVPIPKTPDSQDDPIKPLDELAGSSKDRSLIISSFNCLNAIYANNQSNLHRITEDSPAFRASLQYLPLFVDKQLVDAAINYLYSYLSHPGMTKSFLFHKDMPSVLKLLVSLMISEQVEEKVEEDIAGEVKAATPPEYATKVHDLTSEELEMLLPRGEPQRCFDWMRLMFVASPQGELTQVDFWNLYKDAFAPHQERFPMLVASDVIKNVSTVFPQAQAMVLPGPPPKFVVRGVVRRTDIVDNKDVFICLWQRGACGTSCESLSALYQHVTQEHIMNQDQNKTQPDGATMQGEEGEGQSYACLWHTCPTTALPSTERLRQHVLTHLGSRPPAPSGSQNQNDVGARATTTASSSKTSRPLPPPGRTVISYTRVSSSVVPSSTALTALLCIRLLFRASFVTGREVAPKPDADHFGFPGIVEEEVPSAEDGAAGDGMDIDVGGAGGEEEGQHERAAERRGRRAFVGVRRLLENVKLPAQEEVLSGWISEMIDAGLDG